MNLNAWKFQHKTRPWAKGRCELRYPHHCFLHTALPARKLEARISVHVVKSHTKRELQVSCWINHNKNNSDLSTFFLILPFVVLFTRRGSATLCYSHNKTIRTLLVKLETKYLLLWRLPSLEWGVYSYCKYMNSSWIVHMYYICYVINIFQATANVSSYFILTCVWSFKKSFETKQHSNFRSYIFMFFFMDLRGLGFANLQIYVFEITPILRFADWWISIYTKKFPNPGLSLSEKKNSLDMPIQDNNDILHRQTFQQKNIETLRP